jgi:hypothetical protein
VAGERPFLFRTKPVLSDVEGARRHKEAGGAMSAERSYRLRSLDCAAEEIV